MAIFVDYETLPATKLDVFFLSFWKISMIYRNVT